MIFFMLDSTIEPEKVSWSVLAMIVAMFAAVKPVTVVTVETVPMMFPVQEPVLLKVCVPAREIPEALVIFVVLATVPGNVAARKPVGCV